MKQTDLNRRREELLQEQTAGKIRNLKCGVKVQTAIGWTDPQTGKKHRARYLTAAFVYERLEECKYSDYDGPTWEKEWISYAEDGKGKISKIGKFERFPNAYFAK